MNPQNPITKVQLIEAENLLLEAIKTSNVKALDEMLYNELAFMTPDGQVVTKEMDLEAHRSGAMEVNEINATVEEVNLIGDTASVIVVYDSRGRMFGTPISGRFRYLRVWKLMEGNLKVIGGSCIKIS